MLTDLEAAAWWLILFAILFLALITFGVGWAILQASSRPSPTLLVMALSMLTLLTIVAYVTTREQEIATLTGVGLGALAGAVNSMFNQPNPPYVSLPPAKKEEPPDEVTGGDPGQERF